MRAVQGKGMAERSHKRENGKNLGKSCKTALENCKYPSTKIFSKITSISLFFPRE